MSKNARRGVNDKSAFEIYQKTRGCDTKIVNFTNETYYGIYLSGNEFTLKPSILYENSSITMNLYETLSDTDNVILVDNYEMPPKPGEPIVLLSAGAVLFYSIDEREKTISRYDDDPATAALIFFGDRTKGLYHGLSNFVLNISTNEYYTVFNKKVTTIPMAPKELAVRLRTKFRSTNSYSLDDLDLFYMGASVERKSTYEIDGIPQRDHTEQIRCTPKDISGDEPIVLDNGLGLISILFRTRKGAELFLKEYNGNFVDYLIDRAKTSVEKDHEEDIKHVKKTYRSVLDLFSERLAVDVAISAGIAAVTWGIQKIRSNPKEVVKMFIR